MIRSVEDVLIIADRPLTFEQVCELLPERGKLGVSRALYAAERMKHIRRVTVQTNGVGQWAYEYIEHKDRS